MKFCEVTTPDPYINKLEQVVEVLTNECSPFLQQIGDRMLWRGLRHTEQKPFLKKEVRRDRKPLDTNVDIHLIIDNWFKQKFGYNYRSQATFAVGRKYVAESFGFPYMVFPIGEFTFLWSPVIDDLTYYVNSTLQREIQIDPVVDNINLKDPKVEETVHQVLKNGNFTDKNLKQAIESGNEVMIRCNSYYALNIGSLVGSNLSSVTRYYHEEFIKLLKGHTT